MQVSKFVINPMNYSISTLESSYTKENVALGPLSKAAFSDILRLASLKDISSSEEIVLKIIAEELISRGLIVPEDILGSEEAYLDTILTTQIPEVGFFGTPTCRSKLISDATDAFIFGVPFDMGSPKPGSSLAPKKLREESLSFCFRGGTANSILSVSRRASPFDNFSIVDIGDVFAKDYTSHVVRNRIVNLIKNSPKSAIPIMIGGDHSLTLSAITGLVNREKDLESMSIVQFDSHCDMKFSGIYEKSRWLDLHDVCHANFVSKIMEDFKEINIYQIGVDEFQSLGQNVKNHFNEIANNVEMISDLMLSGKNVTHWAERLPKNKNVYLSIDVDVFSKAYVSETGYPSRCGIDLETFFSFVKHIFDNNKIVGIDLMEFSPLGKASEDSKFISYLLLEVISLLSDQCIRQMK